MKYEAVIGLEIHAELKTNSKMFCSCKNTPFNSSQNENICPVCLGMPGTLPVLNKQAIEWTILTGLALNAEIAEFTKWDRKNYFYPDLPKGYQISQYDLPIASYGRLKIKTENEKVKTIGITRIHLEEDTGTSKHPEGREGVNYSLLDYNRAGVPLMELVTEPEINSASEAKEFCQKYQLILRYLEVAHADMEKGQMRCEANISVRKIGEKKFGTKVEVKNLNSFKAVERAIDYEIERQIAALGNGEKIIQETRGWDDAKGKTYVMRVKETSADYRYFPEPDIPPIITQNSLHVGGQAKLKTQNHNSKLKSIVSIDKIKQQLPELPDEKRKRYTSELKLSEKDADVIINNIEMAKYFESCVNQLSTINNQLSTKIANWIINEVSDLSIKPENLVELIKIIENGEISGKTAKEILPEMKKGKKPSGIIMEKGLKQISDSGELEKIINDVISKNPDAVQKIKSGNKGVIGFLVGQVMRESKGQANPKIVNDILRNKIK